MIEVQHLKKRFGRIKAIDDLSFSVAAGEILGFLGPNGAGKSTTMKVITGFLAPTEGSVSVAGHDITTDTLAAQRCIGYLPEGAPCYEEMTPLSFLRFIGRVRGYTGAELQARVAKAIADMSLANVVEQRIETLSKGFKRRVGLAQAILHDPQVLILDEPTDGLDPNQKHQVRSIIQGLSRDKIVIISTHILEEVTAVCTRAIIIDEGRIVADGTPQELESRSRYQGAVTLHFAEMPGDAEPRLRAYDFVSDVEVHAGGERVTVFPVDAASGLGTKLRSETADWSLAGMYEEQGRLDDVFRQVTGGGA
jgi:ABC-2 type transport system ATP-binding protein